LKKKRMYRFKAFYSGVLTSSAICQTECSNCATPHHHGLQESQLPAQRPRNMRTSLAKPLLRQLTLVQYNNTTSWHLCVCECVRAAGKIYI
jgi:hypothetical protein